MDRRLSVQRESVDISASSHSLRLISRAFCIEFARIVVCSREKQVRNFVPPMPTNDKPPFYIVNKKIKPKEIIKQKSFFYFKMRLIAAVLIRFFFKSETLRAKIACSVFLVVRLFRLGTRTLNRIWYS